MAPTVPPTLTLILPVLPAAGGDLTVPHQETKDEPMLPKVEIHHRALLESMFHQVQGGPNLLF